MSQSPPCGSKLMSCYPLQAYAGPESVVGLFRNAFSTAPDPHILVYRTSSDFDIVTVNGAFDRQIKDMSGGRSKPNAMLTAIGEALSAPPRGSCPAESDNPPGESLWSSAAGAWRLSAWPIRRAFAGAEYWVVRFIEDRQMATATMGIQNEHTLLQAAFDLSPQFLWTAAPTGEYTSGGQRWVELTGRPADEVLDFEWVHEDDRDHVRQAVAVSLATRTDFDVENRIRRPDGSIVWVRSRARPIYERTGAHIGWFGVTEVIDDLKSAHQALSRSSELLTSLLDVAPVSVVLVRLTSGSAPAPGLAQFEFLDLTGPGALLTPQYRPPTVTDCPEPALLAFIRGEEVGPVRYVVQSAETGRRIFEARATALSPSSDLGPQLLLVQTDVTGEVEQSNRLVALEREFSHVCRVNEIGFMATAITHELKQPLTAIANYLELASHLVKQEESASALSAVQTGLVQTKRANTIISRVRDFVRNGELIRAEIGSTDAVSACLDLVRTDALVRGIRLRHERAVETVGLMVDPVRLQQVVVNLLRNAFDAVEAAGTQAEGVLVREAIADGVFRLEVHDWGSGLPSEDCDRVFEPFFTTKKEGMGMGLAICKQLVESEGGSLAADRSAIATTVFTLALPVVAGTQPS